MFRNNKHSHTKMYVFLNVSFLFSYICGFYFRCCCGLVCTEFLLQVWCGLHCYSVASLCRAFHHCQYIILIVFVILCHCRCCLLAVTVAAGVAIISITCCCCVSCQMFISTLTCIVLVVNNISLPLIQLQHYRTTCCNFFHPISIMKLWLLQMLAWYRFYIFLAYFLHCLGLLVTSSICACIRSISFIVWLWLMEQSDSVKCNVKIYSLIIWQFTKDYFD